MEKIVQIGSIANGPWENPSVGRVYDQEGLSPTLNSGGGGQRQPYIIVEVEIDGKDSYSNEGKR